ncbi:SDR family NAD(P)-dependent oxidoreductase [Candidatus Bipolaricaulota bacterium]|nr:SDR family NAD(P)-dependent oxidoreductase [Candidatus Bipolaricaulota bacterium]
MKTAMVWGSTGGIGGGVVDKLLNENWEVLAVSRSSGNFSDAVTEVVINDIGEPDEVESAVEEYKDSIKEVDLWVYAIGDITTKKVTDTSPEDWNRINGANLQGAFLATRYSIPVLPEEAHMVFIGAVSERTELPGLAAYVSAKAGLESFVEVLRKEERNRSISIVRPKAVDTPFWDKVSFDLPHGAKKPEEVANHIFNAYEEGKTGVVDI